MVSPLPTCSHARINIRGEVYTGMNLNKKTRRMLPANKTISVHLIKLPVLEKIFRINFFIQFFMIRQDNAEMGWPQHHLARLFFSAFNLTSTVIYQKLLKCTFVSGLNH